MSDDGLPGPFRPVVSYESLVLGKILSEHQGQSRLVCLLELRPGWLYKEYRDALSSHAVRQLDSLIGLPAKCTPAERRVVKQSTSWPACRVVKGNQTCGVILPLAPEKFYADFQLPGGRMQRRALTVDWLAQPETTMRTRGVRPPSLVERLAVCSSLATTAALFERHAVVYLDWSFTNAFWNQYDHGAYVIDVDGCSFGPRQMIESRGWEDPLHPLGTDGGHAVDRYRVALLVARCVAAVRTDSSAEAALGELDALAAEQPTLQRTRDLVVRAVRAPRAQERPPLSMLAGALQDTVTALDPARALGSQTRVPLLRSPANDRLQALGVPGRPLEPRAVSEPTRAVRSRPAAFTAGDGVHGSQVSPAPPRPFVATTNTPRAEPVPDGGNSAVTAVILGVLGLIAVLLLIVIL